MEVENDLVDKETSLGGTPFPLPLEEGYSYPNRGSIELPKTTLNPKLSLEK